MPNCLLNWQVFLLIDRELPPAKREAALATCTCEMPIATYRH